MPEEGIGKVSHGDILSYEELYLIAQTAVSIGIDKIRITGGEPLVRKDIVRFLHKLAEIPGLKQLVLTTNGMLLEKMAIDLRAAGVQRLNISLDSLNHDTFAQISRSGDLTRVLAGIEAAKRYGFPIKLNMVVMRGVNDHEILDFATLANSSAITVRFIEYMPAIREHNWQRLVVPGSEILERLAQHFTLMPLEQAEMAGPARNFRILGAPGTLGVITPVSHHFCSECNRIRVTSSGMARGCLFAESQVDLKPSLQAGSRTLLAQALGAIVDIKPVRHQMNPEECHHQAFNMSSIGG